MRCLACLFVVLAFPAIFAAQRPPGSLAPGTRVRLWGSRVPDRGLIGTIITQRKDTLFVLPDHDPNMLGLPLRTIRRVDVSTGSTPNSRKGLGAGAFLGAALGLAFGQTMADPRYGAPIGLLLGGGFGAAVGAAVGRESSTEHWERHLAPLVAGTFQRAPRLLLGLRVPLGH